MKSSIVIGATGLVGSHVVIHLLRNGEKVIATKREKSSLNIFNALLKWYKIDEKIVSENLLWKSCDVDDYFSVEDILDENSEVYHCAALVSFHKEDADALKKTNADGTANVVNACLTKKVRKLAYVSSVATLTSEDGKIISENSFWKTTGNESNYAKSKYLAEMEVWRGIEEGLNAVMVNPTIIIGPHDFTKGSVKIIETVAKGLKVYTSGASGFVDVRDVASAFVLLMKSSVSEHRFVLNGTNASFKSIFDVIANEMSIEKPSVFVPDAIAKFSWRIESLKSFFTKQKPLITKETAYSATQTRVYDASKISNQFSFQFTSSKDMIKNACGFYLQQNQKIK